MTTLYDAWRARRDEAERAYQELCRTNGRLKVGPSSNEGLYVEELDNQKGRVSKITKEEARFIINALREIYGLVE